MGQPASTLAPDSSASRVRVAALPPLYAQLCDNVKAGDAGVSVPAATDDVKDALSKILEFSAALRALPKDVEVSGNGSKAPPPRTPEQRLEEIMSSVDSASELFHYISSLAALPVDLGKGAEAEATVCGRFDARVAAYVKSLQHLYQLTKREKQRYEQRQLTTRMHATSQRKVTPPPLPLPTQNCMTMGWEIVVHLLKATRAENPTHYIQALQMLKDNLRPLKPTTYSDSMYLAPSASSSFNVLSECLSALAQPISDKDQATESSLGATTIEALAEVALARGSLATLLNVVLWLYSQYPSAAVDLGVSLSKLAGLKEQQLYGKCEASGELYCCGQNSYGELGIGDDIERHLLTSVSLSGWEDIRQVVSGNEVLAILTNGGVVLTCGLNKSGQCGHGHFDERVMSLRPVQALRSHKIKYIAASNGCEHIIALTETGLAYSWGYNDRGQLGHENLTTKIHLPKLIESLKDKKVGFAAVSYHHSAVVTDSGELYTFGMNDCGQLGLDHTQHMSIPQQVKALESQEVSMVACGLYHTIVCTAAGELFSFGKNDYGQLGLGHSRQIKLPALVPLPNEMVCFVACGYYHSSIVTTSGHTYCFGRNDYGQLGVGSKIHQNSPGMVALSATTRMTRATCGCYHTVLMSEQGQVFVFGRNNKGQLGNRSSADSLLPVPLKVRPEKNARRCIDVAAGFYTTSLIYERKKENDEGDAVILDQTCLVAVCGRVDIDRSGEIEGLSNFGSISTVGITLFEGKWFYEVEVVTSGLIQIGWIDNNFQGSSDQGEGVGDHSHSWSYDGNRQRRWNSGSSSYGEKWKAGDVIGCLLDLDSSEMTFYRNGISLGAAFTDVKCDPTDCRLGLMPGISLERGEIIRVNLGHQPFAHPPTNVGDFDGVYKAMTSPTSAAALKGCAVEQAGVEPPAMEGSAIVLTKNKVFTIGGCLTGEVEATNQVWMFAQETKKWERWADFPIGIKNHQAVSIAEDHILVIGGESTTPTSRHMDLYRCSTTKAADGSVPTWELIQGGVGSANALPAPRAHHTAATIRARLDSMVVVYGGRSTENENLGDVWYLSLEDFSWSRFPVSSSLDPGPRSGCSSAVIGENVFLFGGQDKEEKLRSDLWRYNAFDRVWHLCHDDNIVSVSDVDPDSNSSDQAPRNEFVPIVPEARTNYSICADSGNVWIFGGTSQSGPYLRDMWCYNVASRKWSPVEVSFEGDMEGCASAVLMIPLGSATALPNTTSEGVALSGRAPSQMLLFGGAVRTGDVSTRSAQLREFVAVDTSRNFAADPTRSIATSGKSSVILGSLRAKCPAGTGRTHQQCVPLALDSAVCVLAHLDRLAGNDIPSEEVDTIQLSRCSYRSLCVDPKEQTFAALYSLLSKLSSALQTILSVGEPDVGSSSPSVVIEVLYPTLVVIRLLKLNLFELARSSIDPAEVGLSPRSILPGGTLFCLRELLFKIAENSSPVQFEGESAWFYKAVKQETAATIYHGFSILFPSLFERIEVMNKLMQETSDADPTKKLLVPMLVPCFTSTKMLFQLMSEVQIVGSSSSRSAFEAPEIVAQFASTLLDALWVKTKALIENSDLTEANSLVKKLGEIEATGEFKCLNVLLRGSLYWCSYSANEGWPVIETVSTKLVTFFGHLLGRAATMLPHQVTVLPTLAQHTFVGKLLPFVLVSIGSLPSVRDTFLSTFKDFWPNLEDLLIRVHSVLSTVESAGVAQGERDPFTRLETSVQAAATQSSTSSMSTSTRVMISAELGAAINLPTGTSGSFENVIRAIWKRVVANEAAHVEKVTGSNDSVDDRYRILMPAELVKVFGTSTLVIAASRGVELLQELSKLRLVDLSAVSFLPSMMVISQHVQVDETHPATNCLQPPPAPAMLRRSVGPMGIAPLVIPAAESSVAWLRDLHRILVWLGSHYAASLIIGSCSPSDDQGIDSRWIDSPLLRGGLMDGADQAPGTLQSRLTDAEDDSRRNELLLLQIVNGVGAGKKLVDKVKLALDPGAVGSIGGANPKLMATRLKRQDSVEAALEKSGSIEAVDKAVRVAFAVLLKHSNAGYVNGGLTKSGALSEAVIDSWRSALLLRRWIVREQQKLASERSTVESAPSEELIKERQQALYTEVCEPVIRRGQLLLSLAAVPASTSSFVSAALKLLPGVSAAATYELPKATLNEDSNNVEENDKALQQLKLLMEVKSMDTIEEEDEKIQADIFAFLQYSRKPKPAGETDTTDGTSIADLDERILSLLKVHQQRGRQRFAGLMIFSRLLNSTKSNPSCRLSIIPSLSAAFKRLVRHGDGANAAVSVEKVHYLEALEFVGSSIRHKIRNEFFSLLANLVTIANDHIRVVWSLVEPSKSRRGERKSLSSQVHHVVQEVMQIFEACSIPYRNDDWSHLSEINLLPLITELSSWRSWEVTMQLDFSEDFRSDASSSDKLAILPAGSGQRCPRIVCARSITLGTDLHELKLGSDQGGLAVFHHMLLRGRWYWEVRITAQDEYPVFIGLAASSDDLNCPRPAHQQFGVFVVKDSSTTENGSTATYLRCRIGCTIGVLYDCTAKKLEFYVDTCRTKTILLETTKILSATPELYPAVGIHGAEVLWDLLAPVPEKIWASSNEFRFSAPVVSGCLVASPVDGKTISLDAKTKGRHLKLSYDGTTVTAGDFNNLEDVFETITANQGFDSDCLYAEIQVLSHGRDDRCDLSFDLVSADYRVDNASVRHSVDVSSSWSDGMARWGSFGVLYDFSVGKVTVYPSNGEPPLCRVVNSAVMKRPLIPTVTTLCNGAVFRINFHPRSRPELPPNAARPASIGENCHVSSSNDIQVGKALQMQLQSCDGGEFSVSHAAQNCLVDDASVFSSAKGRNVNLVLRHEIDTPFSVSYLAVRGPGPGYSSPLRHAVVFVTSSVPDLQRLEQYDDLTPEEFASLPFPATSLRSDRNEYSPVAYLVLDGSCAQISKQLAVPVQGRYVVIKLLCPASGTNIDIGYIGVCGMFDKENGSAYAENATTAALCEECGATTLDGVTYSLKDDDSVKMCAACYDDNRGSLEATYFAHVAVDADGQSDASFALCAPRKPTVDRLLAQMAAFKRPKPTTAGSVPISADSSTAIYLSGGPSTRGIKSERSLVWFDDCELFSCGQNNYGELCLGHCNSTTKLEHVPFFSTKSIRDIVGGNEVLGVLMKDGSVYTCGLNKSGQCGNGTFEERVLVATPVRALSGIPIEMIAAANGCEHMLAVASDGSVYAWGYNDRGQLGLGSTISKSHTPRLIESLREKHSVTSAAVSYHHSAVVTSAGELLTFGMNDCGQLGLDHLQHQHTPQLVDALSSQVATRVACGLYHTVVVTAGGELYSFGKNDYGQLGLGHARNVKVPTLVRVTIGDSDEKIVDVSCGYYHTVAITDKGKLITWGRNDYGQLGIGSKEHKNAPQYVPLPLSSRIRKSSCGCYHTLIMLANGRVMVFGRNNKGQLGAGARTLPSADLPLPIPLNSLSSDEVTCIAAGFYSSYILTGRSSQSQDPERIKDDQAQAKDLAEHNSSEALYESLMKEIDRNQQLELAVTSNPLQLKRGNMHRKLPLLKLHAASWAMVRALLYQSLDGSTVTRHDCVQGTTKRDAVLRNLIEFLLGNLRGLQLDLDKTASDTLQTMGGRLDACVTLKNACVGLLTLCATKTQVPGARSHGLSFDRVALEPLYPHFFRNQVLWVLLSCGSADAELCRVIASNDKVLDEILKGIMAPDLASATICIRLAMLAFPLHSVSFVNAAYKKTQGSTTPTQTNILTTLMLLVGNPLVVRPRLCNHELGIERSCSSLCESTSCLKGLSAAAGKSISGRKEEILEQSHIAAAKAAEVVGLLRYLTLSPVWKVAVNASISNAFSRIEKLGDILDSVCAYYSYRPPGPDDSDEPTTIEPVLSEQLNDTSAEESSTRTPETTTASPEVDESTSTGAGNDTDKEDPAVATLRDKKALAVWQKAKDSLDALASIFAAVSIVGGHVETPREGALVVVDDRDHTSRGQVGVLSGIKKDTRGELTASILVVDQERTQIWQPLQHGGKTVANIAVRNLKAVERVPSLLQMFDGLDDTISALSVLVLPAASEFATFSELEHPHNSQVQVILGRRMTMYTKQMQWRATMALSTLLKQMPRLSSVLINGDTQLLTNIAQTIAAEDALKNASLMNVLQLGAPALSLVNALHSRWLGVKQRQLVVEAEQVIDDAFDSFEAETRDDVVRKLGQQNALSWGPDAIQSPRKGSTPGFFNGKPSNGPPSGLQRMDRAAATRAGRGSLPHGAWGVLHPLPQLNENENGGGASTSQAVDYTPFHLTTPIVRVGRAADSCDLIVNDRSVSGRHFHLRRVRREGGDGGPDEYFELQDFSKNGTIVNGVRVHGTSVRVTPGSRISLILSRGGLVTYEFQVRQSHGAGAHTGSSAMANRLAPPPIITAPQAQHVEGHSTIQGQEYQQPLSAVGPGPVEPRSPAELQNRGSRQHSMESRMDAVRSRIPGAQGLRLITSIAESEVPRALISPNPAVESPRVGGFNSPRSSLLQAPGTPAVPSSTVSLFANLDPNTVLSPASHQQRESSAEELDSGMLRAPESTTGTLRVALGRGSVTREGGHRNSLTGGITVMDPSRLKTFSALDDSASAGVESPSLDLLARLRDVGLMQVRVEQCEEALHAMNGDVHSAFTLLHEQLVAEQTHREEDLNSPTVQRLASLLAINPLACANALHRTNQNVPAAIRLLLSPSGAELIRATTSSRSRQRFEFQSAAHTADGADSTGASHFASSADALINLQEIMEENPTYALAESSARHQAPRQRPGSPTKHAAPDGSVASKSQLALWVECLGQVDDRVAQMTSTEMEDEEASLSGLLTAVHSRELLEQIVRLFRDVPDHADNMLAAFGDPVTLRQLILFPCAANDKQNTRQMVSAAHESGTIQRILSRTADEMFSCCSTNSLRANMKAVENLSALCLAIDQRGCWSRRDDSVGVLPQLLRTLLESEAQALTHDGSGMLQQTNIMHNLVVDTLMHTLSRTFVHHGSVLNWEAAMSKSRRPEMLYPKGPIRLSSGIECVAVTSYERIWSVPSPDPLLQFRHKWRKRQPATACGHGDPWSKSTAAEGYVTIWRPVVPNGAKLQQATTAATTWFAFGDVLHVGGDSPEDPALMVRDDGSGLLLPPVGFERVDVSGKGLPKNSENDPDFQRKQVRSVWWPIAPPGYVAFGCVAGSKEDPFQPPALSSTRCIREDLSQRAEAYTCVWRAENWSLGPPTLLKALDQLGGDQRRNQQPESMSVLEMAADHVCVRTSLWSVETDFCRAILPVISVDGEPTDGTVALTLRMSAEDKIMCSPVTVNNAMGFINLMLECQKCVEQKNERLDVADRRLVESAMRPELSAALFALVKQVLSEKLPGSGQTAVALVRALIRLIQSGGEWKDKDGLLYCRSKIIALHQDQEGGLMLHSLLQAFVELLLVVDEQNRIERVRALTSCLDKDANSTINLPFRFQFARADAHKEMLVSHSSKMAVTRHFSGEERKFLLEYHADDAASPSAEMLSDPAMLDSFSCRFEHTPELVMTLQDEVKAEVVYFELTVLEWSGSAAPSSSSSPGVFGFGMSPPEFPLEGPVVGMNVGGANSYAFTPISGKVHSSDQGADLWRWNDQVAAVAIGDVFGCGLRLDTREVFFTKNGRLIGTAFSSVEHARSLHPTVSVSGDCKLLINFGSSGTPGDMVAGKVNFAFRFNTMDYDNVMAGFEWYEQLSQVYGVMQALMDPARDTPAATDTHTARGALLPDEFMLSADNFLSEISNDVCIRVESAHPYDLELQEALVNIPLASSIRVKLDGQCETANSHCLQILQGGDGAENSSSSESEVRAFTGACGGQEVMIEGDSFVWRFPVQSNFQCRVDRVRKGPYLKLENRDTRLSLSRDKGWQTAIGVARFDSGIHIWEVRITFVTASSNIFLGLARRDVRLDSYLGKDNRGWGWIGNRALWHNGSKQRGTYGEKFKTGDVVRMTLDLKRGTLSYALNGKDLGVAFGPGGVGPKLEGTFYPGFALYNQRDSLDLIGGHRLEDGDVLLTGGSGVSGLLPGSVGDDAYYSEDDEGGEIDDAIPNFRMELATALSLMGFPMDWCVYALRHCEDDAEQAADFILANMHVMEALVREESEAQARRLRHREALAAAAAAASSPARPVPARVSIVEASLGDDVDQVDSDDQAGAGVSEEFPGQIGGASDSAAPQNVDKWGVAFTAVPEFSITGRRLLASKYASKLHELHRSQAVFAAEHDNALVQIVNEICESRAEALLTCDPLRMSPEEFVPSDEHLRKFQCLDGIPLAQLQKRFLILRNFNCRLQNSLSFIDLSVGDEMSLLARGARRLRGVIFQNVKLAWWLNILKEQQSPAAARPEIEVDRHRARDATDATGVKDSVFAQCFDQLHATQPSLLRGADRAFKCQFVGEFGDDFGGLYRECLAQISSELQSSVLPLLHPCPNALAAVGDNRDKFVPNVHLRGNARLVHMAEFLGKLIGIAIRTKTPLDLNLPAVFWKTLVGQAVSRRDVESIHHGCFQVVDAIDNISTHGITESMFDEIIDAQFAVSSSARQPVDVVPGGRHVRVLWEDKDDYARVVHTYRLSEFTPVCEDVLRGVATILPAPTIALFTWLEFATLVCGKPTVDVELLRRRTIYGDGCQSGDPHIAHFWDVLGEFTDEQKSSFLRFVWGRSRLPTHAADFTQDFKISGLPKAAGRPDAYLPIAHTCFFSIDLPNYSSREVTKERLLYAITHCLSIDADNTTVAQRAGQGLNWTATATATTATTTAPATAMMTTVPSAPSSTIATATTSAAVTTAAAAVSSVIAGLSAAITE